MVANPGVVSVLSVFVSGCPVRCFRRSEDRQPVLDLALFIHVWIVLPEGGYPGVTIIELGSDASSWIGGPRGRKLVWEARFLFMLVVDCRDPVACAAVYRF